MVQIFRLALLAYFENVPYKEIIADVRTNTLKNCSRYTLPR